MTNAQIVSRIKKECNSEIKKYPGLEKWSDPFKDYHKFHIDVFNELLKYYKKEDINIKSFGSVTASYFLKDTRALTNIDDILANSISRCSLEFYSKNLNRDNNSNVTLDYYYDDSSRKYPLITLYVKINGMYSHTYSLNPEMLPEIIQVFKALDDKYDKLKEEIVIEKAKTKKMSDMIDVTLTTLVKKRFEGRIANAGGYLRENTLFFTVMKSSRNKATFKINVKKFNNDFNAILDATEQFLKLIDIEWLKFEYKGL